MGVEQGGPGEREGRSEPLGAPEGEVLGGPTGSEEKPRSDEAGPIGPFPSWPSVYGTVVVYGVAMILFLWILTHLLDPGAAP